MDFDCSIEGAKKFYGELYGWTFEKSPMPDMEYWLAKRDGKEVCGVMQKPAEVPRAYWLGYLAVESLEQADVRAEKLGAKRLHGPQEIPTIGKFSILEDPNGAAIALFEGTN